MRERCHPGAQTVVDSAIFKRHGARYSAVAAAMHASQINVGLAIQKVRPQCGRMMTYLSRQTGLCMRSSASKKSVHSTGFSKTSVSLSKTHPRSRLRNASTDLLGQRNASLCRRCGLKVKVDR